MVVVLDFAAEGEGADGVGGGYVVLDVAFNVRGRFGGGADGFGTGAAVGFRVWGKGFQGSLGEGGRGGGGGD